MKRLLTLSLSAALLLAGCSSAPKVANKTTEELTATYVSAITAARDEEANTYIPTISAFDEGDAEFILPMLGLNEDNTSAFAVAVSPMMTKAYGVAAVMPVDGKEDEVVAGLQGFVELQKSNFEMYLMDQYDVALGARLSTLDDGTVLLVMTEGAATEFPAIQDAILAS